MAGAKINIGVTGVAQFKQGMNQAKQAAKTLDAQLALTEKEFRATGDAEGYMAKKTAELKAKLEAQKSVVDNAQRALEQMAKNGVDRSSASYQKLYQEMLKAKGELLDTENALNGVADAGDQASDGVSEMNAQLKRIGDGVNYDNITNGLEKIESGIENVISKAFKMGQALVRNTLGAGAWADELATTATQWEDTLESMSGGKSTTEFLQRMRYTSSIIDTDVDTILDASDKLKKNREKGGKEFMGALAYLGIDPHGKNDMDLFWEAGEAIQALGKDEDKVSYAQQIFGKSWRDLMPLFKAGREEYEKWNNSWSVVSDEQVENLTKMDDAFQVMNNQWTTLKNTVLAELSTVLTPLMEKLTALMEKFNEYLQTPQGQEMLQHLSDALLGMFEDITKIDPEKVMEGLIGIFDKIKEGLEWIINNKDTLVGALKVIAAGFGLLKLGNLAMNVVKISDGFKNILGLGGGKAAAGGDTVVDATTTAASTAGSFVPFLKTIAFTTLLSYMGAKALGDYRRANPEKILGTEQHLEAKVGKDEELRSMFAQWVDYQAQAERVDPDDENRVIEIYDRITELWDAMQGHEGFGALFDSYNAWRQEQGLSNSQWELPDEWRSNGLVEKMDKMTAVAEDMTGDTANRNKATSEMAAAANNMQGLPAAIEMAVRNGVSNIRVYLDGQLVSNSVGNTMANAIAGLVK